MQGTTAGAAAGHNARGTPNRRATQGWASPCFTALKEFDGAERFSDHFSAKLPILRENARVEKRMLRGILAEWPPFWIIVLLLANPAFAQLPPAPLETTQKVTGRAAARFLEQASWGPTPLAIAEVQNAGINGWLENQFQLNTSSLPDQPMLTADGKTNTDFRPLQAAFFANAVSGEDQLRQRVAFALSEIWVVSAVQLNRAYAFPSWYKLLSDNAFGNYREIIKAVTLSPAMGFYLNMANNNKGNAAKGTAANENYARELMQLFTLGLTQLNPDGTPVLDAANNPVPTYDQAVVTNTAKALTGWTYPTAPGAAPKPNNPQYFVGQMFAAESNHDTSAKTIAGGVQLPAGQTAEQDLDSVIDALMAQKTMAPFISQQLIQHLVTSNPSPAYVARVANAFLDNGEGIRGDMKAVVTAILTDPEARAGDDDSSQTDSNFGHLREPVLFMTGMLRGLNATLGASSSIYNYTSQLGQNLFYPASVFSYFSPQYRTEKGLLGPEFQIYSTQTASTRANIVNRALYGTLDSSTTVDLGPFTSIAGSSSNLLSAIDQVFLHGSMSANLYNAADAAASAQSTNKARTQAALYVVLTSGEYQVIH
jgi:uncharacterized protein (DUF1800 family)